MKPERIKLRIFVPLVVAMSLFFAAFALGIYKEQRRANERSIHRAAEAVQRMLEEEQKRCVETMTLTIQALANDDRVRETAITIPAHQRKPEDLVACV